MGQIAARIADRVIITNDNPRNEEPGAIVEDIKSGIDIDSKCDVFIELDREKAISQALRDSAGDDIILIAGKGHENYQICGNEKRHFSDVETVASLLS